MATARVTLAQRIGRGHLYPPPVPSPRTPHGRALIGVFAATLLGFVAVGAVLPVLPRYVRGPIGAGDLAVGIVVGAYTGAALICRPLAGRAADRRGRRITLVVGALLIALAGVLYLVPAGVPGLVITRLILGIGEGAIVVAGSAWVVDLAPPDRRGQVIGLFGLGVWGGLALGPPIGEGLLALGGYSAVWAFAALGPLVGALVAARLPDAHRPEPAGTKMPLLPGSALRPGVVIGLASVGYAAMAGFVVLHLAARGDGSGSAVFIAFAGTIVAARVLLGRAPDRFGSRRTAVAAGTAETAGLIIIGLAGSWPVAALGGVVMGAGFSVLYPALALLVLEGADDRSRGAALGAFSAFFDIGVGVGAPLAGAVASVWGYPSVFYMAAAFAATGAAFSFVGARARVPQALEAPSPA